MGFDAVWISPIIKNTPGGYHGYWAKDINDVNENFGTKQDLIDFVNACHSKGIWVMVDVVANHVGPVGIDYSTISPFNKAEHYHSRCSITDFCSYSNQENIEYCRLADLPDLDQSNSFVKSTLLTWVKSIVSTYGIDGLRIDTVAHVPKSFWSEFSKAAGVYTVGEVFCGDYGYTGQYIGSIDAILNYPLYFAISSSFHSSNLRTVASTVSTMMSKYGDNTKYLGVFVDNHDNARFLHKDGCRSCLLNALVFSLFVDGIPMVYYGDEQAYGGGDDPLNREQLWTNMDPSFELYKALTTAISVRKNNAVWEQKYKELWVDDSVYIFGKGVKVIVALHIGGNEGATRSVPLPGFTNGAVYCDAYNSGDCFTVTNNAFSPSFTTNQVKLYVKK